MKNGKIRRILGIDTSCDATAISIVAFSGSTPKPPVKILSNIISSQVKLHAKFGGVVPNLAKREHQKNLVPVLKTALKKAEFFKLGIMNNGSRERKLKIHNSKFTILNSIFNR